MEPDRLLVVDDSLTIRRALEFILKPKGFALEFAADGREALDKAASFQPDLVLLDYVLPDMRGPDVCSALAAIPVTAQTPVILVSAKGASIRQAYQDAQNVVSYITKPFKPQVVLSVVENALSRGRPARAPAATSAPTPSTEGPTQSEEPAHEEPGTIGALHSVTLDESFSALLGQLEDSVSAQTRHEVPLTRSLTRLGDPLRRVQKRLHEIGQHLENGRVAPYRLRADGSFANVADTLLETHRLLCEATLSLAAAGAPGPELPVPPETLVAVPREHVHHEALARLAETHDDTLLVDGDFASLPWIVHLMKPRLVIATLGASADLDDAIGRAHTDDARRLAVAPDGTTLDRTFSDFEAVDDLDGIAAAMGDVDADTSDAGAIGLEVVSL